MSQENVKVLQAVFAAWNARDMNSVGERYDPEVIMRTPEGWPEPGPYVGSESVLRQLEQNRETFDYNDRLDPITDFLQAGDRVVVRFIWRGTGHGPAFGLDVTAVYTLRRGKFFLVEYFRDHAEALEAVGLLD